MNGYLQVVFLICMPLLVWVAVRKRFPAWLNPPLYAAIFAVFLYLFIVVNAAYYEAKADSDLQAFDAAHAGVELTEAQRTERNRLGMIIGHDTGRTFAPFTGAVAAVIYFFLIWIVIVAFSRFRILRQDN